MSMPKQPERCDNCRFWDRSETSSERIGDCRRRPPRISNELLRFYLPGRNVSWDDLDDYVYEASAFPSTQEESWCGEHEPARKAVPA